MDEQASARRRSVLIYASAQPDLTRESAGPVDWRPALDFSELMSPEDVTGKLLVAVFGPAAVVATIVLLAKVVGSWFRPAAGVGLTPDDTTDLTALRTAVRTRLATVRIRLTTTAVGGVVTALLVLAQLLWLWSASHVARGLSYLWHAPFGTGRVDLDGLTNHDSSDLISTLYLVASVATLAVAYASAFRPGRRDVIGGGTIVLALPLMLPWGLFCLVGALFGLVMAGIRLLTGATSGLTDDGRAFIAVTLVVLSYTVVLYVALATTRTIAGYWRREAW
jgi:hypothetical protein